MKTKDKNKNKTFDAVKFMREQRDRISKEIMNFSPEEIVKYFERKDKKVNSKPSPSKYAFVLFTQVL